MNHVLSLQYTFQGLHLISISCCSFLDYLLPSYLPSLHWTFCLLFKSNKLVKGNSCKMTVGIQAKSLPFSCRPVVDARSLRKLTAIKFYLPSISKKDDIVGKLLNSHSGIFISFIYYLRSALQTTKALLE